MMLISVSLGIPFNEVRNWSAAEISLYRAYYRVHPWGEDRADLRNAMSMQMQAEIHRDRKRRTEPYTVQDFMPFYRKPEPEPEELRDKIKRAFSMAAKGPPRV